MQPPNKLQIVVKNLVKIAALLLRLGVNHRQVKADSAYVKSAYEYGLVLFVCRVHAASLIPWGEKGTAAHGRNDFFIFLIHACHVALPRERKPVGVHGLCGALNSRAENVLQLLAGAVEVLIIEEHNLGEQNRLLALLLALSVFVNVEERDGCHLFKFSRSQSCGHGDKGVVPPA